MTDSTAPDSPLARAQAGEDDYSRPPAYGVATGPRTMAALVRGAVASELRPARSGQASLAVPLRDGSA